MKQVDKSKRNYWHSVWTNAFYPIAGIFAIIQQGVHAVGPASALIALGYGSGMYHWYRNPKTNAWDWYGMYAVSLSCAGYLLYSEGITLAWMWAFVSLITCWVVYPIFNKYRILVFTCACLFVSAAFALPLYKFLYVSGVFAVALVLRLVWEPAIENKKPVTEDILHAIWHVLTSIGFALLFW